MYIQRITMCPHGYHHNGFMATPALGTQEVRFIFFKKIYKAKEAIFRLSE